MKVKSTRAEQKLATRKRLINAALKLFAEKGILSTTTAEIAKSIDMSHGSVFMHFPTREDLVNAVIDEFGKRLSVEFRREINHRQGLRQVLKSHLRVLEEFEDFYARLAVEAPLLPLSVRGTLFTLQSGISHELNTAATQDRKLGQIKTIQPHLLFNTWIGLIHYYLANKDLFAPNKSVIAEKGDELLKHYISLIKQ